MPLFNGHSPDLRSVEALQQSIAPQGEGVEVVGTSPRKPQKANGRRAATHRLPASGWIEELGGDEPYPKLYRWVDPKGRTRAKRFYTTEQHDAIAQMIYQRCSYEQILEECSFTKPKKPKKKRA